MDREQPLPLTHVAADGSITTFPANAADSQPFGATITGRFGRRVRAISIFGVPPATDSRRCITRNEKLDSVVFVAVDRNNDPWITTSSGRAYSLSSGKWTDETETLGKKPGVIGAMADDAGR